MGEKEARIMTGAKAFAQAVENGEEPNADLVISETQTKAESALALRIAGTSYTNIAKALGYASATRARLAVERVLAASADSPEDRDQQRVLADKRLNRLLQSVMAKAVDPKDPDHLAYNARALAITDRVMRLWGVDAPAQVQITPTDEHLQQYVAHMMALARKEPEAEEADIIDADPIEDDR
jgi:hypothetical protein